MDGHHIVAAVDERMLRFFRQLVVGGLRVETHGGAQAGNELGEIFGVGAGIPGLHRCERGGAGVRDHQVNVDFLAHTQPIAGGARPVGGVKGERAGFQLVDSEGVAVGAGEFFAETAHPVRVVVGKRNKVEHHYPIGEPQGGLNGVGETLLLGGFDGQPIHYHINVVLDLLFQGWRVGKLVGFPIDSGPRIALGGQVSEQVHEFALAGAYHRRQHLEP